MSFLGEYRAYVLHTCVQGLLGPPAAPSGREVLGSNAERWQQKQEELTAQQALLASEDLLSCAFAAFLGPLPARARRSVLMRWKEELRQHNVLVPEKLGLARVLLGSSTSRAQAQGPPGADGDTSRLVVNAQLAIFLG